MICALVTAFFALVIIGLGMVSMAKNEAFREKYSNRLMKARVILQGLAIFFLILAFATGS
jgi:hypothetical protein